MRITILIGLPGLLVGTALAQQGQLQMEIPLRVSYTDAVVLTADTPQVERPFRVDSQIQASISVLTNSSTMQVTLIDPGGAEHLAEAPDSTVAASYIIPLNSDASGGRSFNFDLQNAALGMWKVRLGETDFSGPRAAVLTVYNIGGVGVALVRTGRDYPVNQPLTLGLIVADSQGGLPRSAISTVTASIRADGGAPATPITFADDGVGQDGLADDGSYAATFSVGTPGSYTVAAKIEGVRNGVAFARTAAGRFRVVSPCGTIGQGVQSKLADSSLELTFTVNVAVAGVFRLAATLSAPNGNQISLSHSVQMPGGSQAATVSFPLTYLQALGANGPYQVSEARLSCVQNEGTPDIDVFASDRQVNLGPTVPLNVLPAGVTPPPPASGAVIALSPGTLDFGKVTTGTGKDLTLTVQNSGGAALAVSALAADHAQFSVTAPPVPFTVAPGGQQAVTVHFSAGAVGTQKSTLSITSNDLAHETMSIPLTGTGVAPAPAVTVLFSDSFNRADADRCALGQADLTLGGSGAYYYLPIWPANNDPSNPVGANIVAGALQNNGKGAGGVAFASLADVCSGWQRARTISQDLNIKVDVLAPTDATGHVTQAGPFFRGRPAARGDGMYGGDNAGYWVQLVSTGEVKVKNLNTNVIVATSAKPAAFDPTVFHTLEIAAQGATLGVAVDGQLVTFTQNGSPVTAVSIPATGGSNYDTAGIIFSSEGNAGQIGGQRARNLVVTAVHPLETP